MEIFFIDYIIYVLNALQMEYILLTRLFFEYIYYYILLSLLLFILRDDIYVDLSDFIWRVQLGFNFFQLLKKKQNKGNVVIVISFRNNILKSYK